MARREVSGVNGLGLASKCEAQEALEEREPLVGSSSHPRWADAKVSTAKV